MKQTPQAASPADPQTPGSRSSHEHGDLHRLLVDRVSDYAIFALDARGYILTWNTGARRLKLYTPEEAIGRHFSMFYPAEDLANRKPERELEIAIATGQVEDEGWRIRKDGTRFWANVLITALRDDAGQLLGFAKVTRDLTERRAAYARAMEDARHLAAQEAARAAAESQAGELRTLAEQLRAQTAELERRSADAEAASRAKSQFLAAMSHELRTPLNAIGGYTQLLQMGLSGPVTPSQREQLDRIHHSQAHLLGIINDILNFSRMEAGQVVYEVGPVDVQELIGLVVPLVSPQAASLDIRLTTGPCDPDVVAQADRAKVEQILLNLLSNAVKFTGKGGEIEVSCHAEGETVRIAVRDTGIGIPADRVEDIFAPFVQVGRSLASPKEGTGLGLAISRDLARAMQGDLAVESTEGAGSTFTLSLPRRSAA